MSLEKEITALVTAANNLTSEVSGKISAIDKRMAAAAAQFDEWRNEKDLEGEPSADGTIRRNIAQGYVSGTGAPYGVDAKGIFAPTALGKSEAVYMHIRLPLNVGLHDKMFWINVKGYSYGSAAIIDETLVGYCYSADRKLVNKSAFGNMNPDLYVDANGNIVARLLIPNIYVTTIRIDTMKVGGDYGILFDVGQITAKLSLAATIVF